MAATLNFKFVANDKGLQQGIRRSKKELTGLEKATAAVSRGMARSFAALGVGIGLSALVSGLKRATMAAYEDNKAQRLLALQLRTTKDLTDTQIASVEKLISGWQRTTGVLDDEIRPAYAKLVRATKSTRQANILMRIALDGAAASGKDLGTVTDILSKAFNGNFTSLYKLAPQLKATKGGIDDYAKSVAGAAKTAADPFAKAKAVFTDIQEQIGGALLPALTAFANWLTKNGPVIQKQLADLFDPNTAVGYQIQEFGKSLDKLFKRFDPKGENSLVGFFNVFNTLLIGTLQILGKIVDTLNTISNLFNAPDMQKVLEKVNSGKFVGYAPNGVNLPQVDRSNSTYNINVNSTNITGGEIIKWIKQYELQTGRKYLTQ